MIHYNHRQIIINRILSIFVVIDSIIRNNHYIWIEF